MKGILINSRQIEYFKVMLKKGYDDGDFYSRHKALGALELLLNQPQEEWFIAQNMIGDSTLVDITNPWRPIFTDDVAHKKGE